MKNILIFMLMSVLGMKAYAVETVKVNEIVAEILNEIASNDDFVDSLGIELDPVKTDLSKPSVGVSIEASTRRASWSSETTSLVATLELETAAVDEEDYIGVQGVLGAKLKTDVFKFSKFIADQDVCSGLYYYIHNDESAACLQMQKELKEAKVFSEQIRAVSKGFEGFKVELLEALEVLKAKQEAAENEEEKIQIGYDIDSVQDSIEVLNSVIFTEKNEGLFVKINLDEEEDINISINIEVTETSVDVWAEFNLVVYKGVVDSSHSFITEILTVLESNTPESREYVTSIARFYIGFLKDIVE